MILHIYQANIFLIPPLKTKAKANTENIFIEAAGR
jgi:hypothetical protein